MCLPGLWLLTRSKRVCGGSKGTRLRQCPTFVVRVGTGRGSDELSLEGCCRGSKLGGEECHARLEKRL